MTASKYRFEKKLAPGWGDSVSAAATSATRGDSAAAAPSASPAAASSASAAPSRPACRCRAAAARRTPAARSDRLYGAVKWEQPSIDVLMACRLCLAAWVAGRTAVGLPTVSSPTSPRCKQVDLPCCAGYMLSRCFLLRHMQLLTTDTRQTARGTEKQQAHHQPAPAAAAAPPAAARSRAPAAAAARQTPRRRAPGTCGPRGPATDLTLNVELTSA